MADPTGSRVTGVSIGLTPSVVESEPPSSLKEKVSVPTVKDPPLPSVSGGSMSSTPLHLRTMTGGLPKPPLGGGMPERPYTGSSGALWAKHGDTVPLPALSRGDLSGLVLSDKPGGKSAWEPNRGNILTRFDVPVKVETQVLSRPGGSSEPPTLISTTRSSERVSVELRPDDLDRLWQAAGDQSAFIGKVKARNQEESGVLSAVEPRTPHAYADKASFEREARDILVGRDASNKKMPAREELARGWALFNNAKNAKPDTVDRSINHFIVFGRTPDVNHTGASPLGFTSEYNNGPILMPERWNYFMNTCWVMGGIKGEACFVSGTKLEQVSRAEARDGTGKKAEDDMRSDWSEVIDPRENPLHYTITVSVAELTALKQCGYVAEDHPVYGVILKPGTSEVDVAKRANASFTNFQIALNEARVEMAMQNMSGDDYIAPSFIEFTKQGGPTMTPEALARVDTFVKSITTDSVGGLPTSDPTNYLVRKVDFKVGDAVARIGRELAADTQRGHSTGPSMSIVNGAWEEILGSTTLATDAALSALVAPLAAPEKDLVHLEMLRLMGEKRTAVEGGAAFGETTHQAFLARATGVATHLGDIPPRTADFQRQLAALETDFKAYITTNGRADASRPPRPGEAPFGKDEADTIFAAFRREAAFQLGADPRILVGLDLRTQMTDFIHGHKYSYGMEPR